jgi:putative ABC transport system substrate-binding protein
VRRREFITLLGGAATWPATARAQQATMPVVGILNSAGDKWVAAFPKGLSEEGQIEGRNVAIELRSTGQYGEVPSLAAELVQRRVPVIAALGGPAAAAAASTCCTCPIAAAMRAEPAVKVFAISNSCLTEGKFGAPAVPRPWVGDAL